MFKCLADFPRASGFFRFPLQIAPRHVERNRVAVNMTQRFVDRDTSATAFQRHYQFELKMDIV